MMQCCSNVMSRYVSALFVLLAVFSGRKVCISCWYYILFSILFTQIYGLQLNLKFLLWYAQQWLLLFSAKNLYALVCTDHNPLWQLRNSAGKAAFVWRWALRLKDFCGMYSIVLGAVMLSQPRSLAIQLSIQERVVA